jgi:hypothetical protein
VNNKLQNEYSWLSYDEVYQQSDLLGNYLKSLQKYFNINIINKYYSDNP